MQKDHSNRSDHKQDQPEKKRPCTQTTTSPAASGIAKRKQSPERIPETKESELTDFSIRMSKLSQSHMEIERRLAAANRDLLIIQADQTTPPTIRHPPPPHIPISTQGKDALYWHQACRTLQRQYTETKNELENKTDQFIRLNESYKFALKRLEEAESQRDKENPPPADTRRFLADYGS
jgi:hypothetical protein